MPANADKIRQLHDNLTAQVEALVSGDDWARFLTVASRFHTYSANNVLAILMQRPDAIRVAGYRAWQRLGRQVNKGAKGIAILAPCVYRRRPVDEADPAENPALARVLRGFTVVHVFDQSDTTGEELPDVSPVLLEGESSLWDALAAQVASAGYTLSQGHCGSANGVTDLIAHTVVVADHLSGRQADKTLCHDL
ncbi:MAG: ArdC family protein [Acidimicrobiales bacterium]